MSVRGKYPLAGDHVASIPGSHGRYQQQDWTKDVDWDIEMSIEGELNVIVREVSASFKLQAVSITLGNRANARFDCYCGARAVFESAEVDLERSLPNLECTFTVEERYRNM